LGEEVELGAVLAEREQLLLDLDVVAVGRTAFAVISSTIWGWTVRNSSVPPRSIADCSCAEKLAETSTRL